jgi:hypothetical protein
MLGTATAEAHPEDRPPNPNDAADDARRSLRASIPAAVHREAGFDAHATRAGWLSVLAYPPLTRGRAFGVPRKDAAHRQMPGAWAPASPACWSDPISN